MYPNDFHVDIDYNPRINDQNYWKKYQIVAKKPPRNMIRVEKASTDLTQQLITTQRLILER